MHNFFPKNQSRAIIYSIVLQNDMTKKYLNFIIAVLLAAELFLICPNALAISSSPNYQVYNGQVSSGGGTGSSAGYSSDTSSSPVGNYSSSPNYSSSGGTAFVETPSAAPSPTPVSTAGVGTSMAEIEAPEIINLEIRELVYNQAKIYFETDVLSASYIQYGKNEAYDLQTGVESSFGFEHEFLLGNLSAGTEYNFTIHIKGVDQVVSETRSYSFTTVSLFQIVENAQNFIAQAVDSKIKLTWQNPDIPDLEKVILVRSENSYSSTLEDGQIIYSGLAEVYQDADIKAGQKYYYALFVIDTFDNQSSGVIAVVQIEPTEEIKAVQAEEIIVPETAPPIEPEAKEPIIEKEIDYEKVIPAQPIELPDKATEIVIKPETEQRIEQSIEFLTMVKQNYQPDFVQASDIIEKLSSTEKENVSKIKFGIIDQSGKLIAEKYNQLNNEERAEIEKIIKQPLPKIEKQKQKIQPFAIKSQINGGKWHIFQGAEIIFSLPQSVIEENIKAIYISIEDQSYLLNLNQVTKNYEAQIKAPDQPGQYEVIIQLYYNDLSIEKIHQVVLVDPYGYVYTKKFNQFSWQKPWQILTTRQEKLANAMVTLYWQHQNGEWQVWPAHLFNQYNPIITDETGEFAFLVPAGKYYLAASLQDYYDFKSSEFEVKDQIVNMNIRMKFIHNTILIAGLISGIILLILIILIICKIRKNKQENLDDQIIVPEF